MNDLDRYPLFELTIGHLIPLSEPKFKPFYHYHHFVEKTIRKNDPAFYKRVEHLQKLILIPADLNLCIANIRPERFKEHWKLDKHLVLFNRKLWRSGVYED